MYTRRYVALPYPACLNCYEDFVQECLEIQEELLVADAAATTADGELRQSLVTGALNILVDQCRSCGLAFDQFDGCFAISCECSTSICGYCLHTGTSTQIHTHIATNECWVRRQMFPVAQQDTFHQGASKDEEFGTARRIRIAAEMHELFEVYFEWVSLALECKQTGKPIQSISKHGHPKHSSRT